MIINYDFEMNHKTRICFGNGKVQETGTEAANYGKKALIVSDKAINKAGIVKKVTDSLDQAGIAYVIFDDVMPNPRDTGCEAAAALGKDFGAEMVIGIGGGSAMDSAKAANVLMTNGKDCDYWANPEQALDFEPLPTICVPTTSGTGSEVTYEAVITSTKTNVKISISDGSRMAPRVAIMDPELTYTVPPLVTASTGMDALTHAIEAFTCSYAQPISDALAIYAIEKIAGSIQQATENGTDAAARRDMMLGSLMAGMAFTNSFLGAVHSLSERIGGFYDTPHGIANSIFLPWVTEYNMCADWEKHALVAKYLGVDITGLSREEAAQKGVAKLFAMNESLGIPKFKEVKHADPADFPMIAASCVTHGCAEANPREIGEAQFLDILKKAYNY